MTWINRGPLGKGNWITDEHGRQIAVTYSERINPKSVEDTAKILAAEDMLKALRSTTDYMEATGTKSSGFNRLSTLRVVRAERNNGKPWYEAKSSGFGLRAPWLATNSDSTLARALRGLQQHYEQKAATYAGHARALESARKLPQESA